ncbi:hypothetical protein HFO84_35665 [Rhizobium leguminosarum]|uniref:hypothetical protein n=1 Tax=Rhizobium leguminosarum TaxID=384 RepID=UPI001C95DE37|nr:hypothetical protein [Rhizobium leguminosarum]MBY5482611.1 hypothetical protein [Rhizobium leguminosarum]
MNIETFPEYAAATRHEPSFVYIGEVWEMEILARAFTVLGCANLIISDGLSFLADRLVRGAPHDPFVHVSGVDDDHGSVDISDHLLDDLKEGCAQLAVAIAKDQCSSTPRILDAAADHASRVCREICRLA